MSRRLVVSLPALSEKHRKALTESAEQNGFEILFPEGDWETADALAEAEVLFTASSRLPALAPKLKWMCTPYAGADGYLATGLFSDPDVLLSNSSGAYGVTIAEHIVMVTLEMFRRRLDYDQILQARGWRRDLPIRSIHGSRITLLGTGDIGQEATVRLRAFSPAEIRGVNRSGRNPQGLFDRILGMDRLAEVLPETDLLILALPGTPETRRVLNAGNLPLLPDGAVVVNVGRGSAIEQEALEKELRVGRLYAALDVFEQEPLPPDSTMWECPNLLITPHTAGNMTLPWTVERIIALFLEDFDNYCAGRPLLRRVDPGTGY